MIERRPPKEGNDDEARRTRFQNEMIGFDLIYNRLKRHLSERERAHAESNDSIAAPDEWARVFAVDFDSMRKQHELLKKQRKSERPGKEDFSLARIAENKSKKSKAARDRRESLQERLSHAELDLTPNLDRLIEDYKLHQLRPHRVFVSDTEKKDGEKVASHWAYVESDDPIFWRALLEVFCRLEYAERGAPEFWSQRRYFELACDAFFLRNQLPRWSKSAAAKALAQHKILRKKYVEPSRADNPRQERKSVRGASGIERRLAELEGWIGGLDDRGMIALSEKDPSLFKEVFDRSLRFFTNIA